MAPKHTVEKSGVTFRVFNNSIMVDGVAKPLYLKREPTDDDLEFLEKLVDIGYNQKAEEVRRLLAQMTKKRR